MLYTGDITRRWTSEMWITFRFSEKQTAGSAEILFRAAGCFSIQTGCSTVPRMRRFSPEVLCDFPVR